MVSVDDTVTARERLSRKALRSQAIKAIGEHLKVHGSKNWSALRATYDEIPDRTWWNWVASAKQARSIHSAVATVSNAATPALSAAALEDSEQKIEFSNKQIRRLNLTGVMVKQMQDIDLLQSYAVTEDGIIKNFAIFTQALSLRERAMASFAKSVIPLTDKLLLEDFNNAVIDVISAVDKDVGVKVVQALADIQGKGKTVVYTGKSGTC